MIWFAMIVEMTKLKTIFMGTPDFALSSLQSLIDDSDFEVVAVVTQEDKKVGRKQEITPSPVKQLALKNDLPVFQPPKIKGNTKFLELMKNLKPDLVVVVAYGQILPPEFLKIAKYGAVNIHPSLLPKYRGATPIEAALINGDEETGVTIMKITEKLDAGDILEITKLPIEPSDNAESLTVKLSLLGGKILPFILKDFVEGAITPIPQNEKQMTFCHKIEKNDGLVDLAQLTARQILNRLRAYTPWPSVFLTIDGKRLKLIDLSVDENLNLKPGEMKDFSKSEVAIGTKKGAIIPHIVQLEGKNPMKIQDFLLGNRSLFSKLLTKAK